MTVAPFLFQPKAQSLINTFPPPRTLHRAGAGLLKRPVHHLPQLVTQAQLGIGDKTLPRFAGGFCRFPNDAFLAK